jgi:2Fe-2S ferredoxin
MPKVEFHLHDGQVRIVEAREGWSLMEAARNAGVPGIIAVCGGRAMCSTCHVFVDEEWQAIVGPPGEEEMFTLDLAPEVSDASRLSCQITMRAEFEGLRLRVPKHQA